MKFSRFWAMPTADTFDCEPIKGFVQKYLLQSKVSVDPFARNSRLAKWRNDLNPDTAAEYHLDAEIFLKTQAPNEADLLIMGMVETQSAMLYKRVRDAAIPILSKTAVVLSFGWSTVGMGKERGFEIVEILLVCHGGAHNDTICMAERRIVPVQHELEIANSLVER